MNQLEKEMKKENLIIKCLKNWIKTKVFLVFLLVLVVGSIAIGVNEIFMTKNKITKIGFENIGEMATQSAYCSEINTIDASRELFGTKIPFTQSKYIYSYDFIIKAGFDFGEIDWKENEKNKTITVWLPKVRVLSNEIDLDSFELYHEDESIFRPITLEENNDSMRELREKAEEGAIKNGLLENARSNVETILTSFFGNVYDLDEYTIEFKDK